MKALQILGPRQAEIRDLTPLEPSQGSLLVEVERAGICGTDIELFTGEMAYYKSGRTTYPLQLGHEWTGIVVAAGSPEDKHWIGKRVTGDTMLGCGSCATCLGGKHYLCPTRIEVGITDGWAGALGEQMLVPTRYAYEIPDSISVAAAAMIEPGGNSLRAVEAAGLESGGRLLILGAGTIGLLAAQFALANGLRVHVSSHRAGSLALARELGVQETSSYQELEDSGERFQSVIDATSIKTAPQLALDTCEPGGRIVLIGLSEEPSQIDTRQVALQDQTVVGILSASPGLAGAIKYFASGQVNPEPLISEVIGLDSLVSRLNGNRSADAGPGPKIHVDPRL